MRSLPVPMFMFFDPPSIDTIALEFGFLFEGYNARKFRDVVYGTITALELLE